MTGTILVAYGTKHGSTREVAEAVAQALKEHGLDVETLAAARVDDLEPYAGVVVGGAIYMGRWHPDAVEFLERHRHALATRPVAVFGMGARTTDRRRLRLRESRSAGEGSPQQASAEPLMSSGLPTTKLDPQRSELEGGGSAATEKEY